MELKVWAESFFSVYRYLGTLANAIDSYVEIRANSCFYKNLSNITLCSTQKVFEDLTGLINKKIDLINIKCLTEKILEKLPSNQARFVILKYIENKTFDKTAECMEVSIRSVLRWHNLALKNAGEILAKKGYDDKKLRELVGNEKWILNIAKDFEQNAKNERQKKVLYINIIKYADKSYKKYLI